ncbi:MAG: glycosyltransferase [Vicinamibacterales bacterium]
MTATGSLQPSQATSTPASDAAHCFPGGQLTGLDVTFVVGTLGQGGAERQLFYVARALVSSGARVRVLTLARGEFWEPRLRDAGAAVVWVGKATSRLARLVAVYRDLRAHRPHVVHSFHFYTNLYAGLAGRVAGVPDIGAIRSNGASDIASVGGVLARLCLRLPRTLVANSASAIRYLEAAGVPPSRLRLLANVIDTDQFADVAPHAPGGVFALAAIGRLGPEKRFDRMLRIVAALKRAVPRAVHLTIAGGGPLRADLEGLVDALDLGADVTFTGPVADVRPILASAHCLLLTSDWEGTPNVILEAMALGRAVVATDVGGVTALVENGRTGFVCAPADESALVGALSDFARDDALSARFGREGRVVVDQRYSLRSLPDSLASLYSSALRRPWGHV